MAKQLTPIDLETASISYAGEDLLIEELKSGNHEAFTKVFRTHCHQVYNAAYKILGNRSDAEEVLQEVFLTVYQKAKSFSGRSRFSTWLYRLTVNAALTRLRRRKDREVPYEEVLPRFQDDGHHLVRPVVDWSDSLEDEYDKQELQRRLRQALGQLRPVDKAVLVLSDIEGLADREVAQAVGLTVSAVKARLHRARLFVRGQLAVQLGYSST